MIHVEFTISRRHLVVFAGMLLAGLLLIPGVSWAAQRFVDVPTTNVFASDIEWMADHGITKGCNPPANTEYCPDRYVTRGQMAAFMHRLSGGDNSTLDGRLDAIEDLLAGVSRNGETLQFSGMNLQVVNGMGKTNSKNTLGNVIIGYNTWTGGGVPFRGGSHYLVVGDRHQYRSWGGIVAGDSNTASGDFASVLGGSVNTASGYEAVVLGGYGNTASGNVSVVSGGGNAEASGFGSSVSGGVGGLASGHTSSVSGGYYNIASGDTSSVSSGVHNTAAGANDAVVGGDDQTCSGAGAIACGEGSFGLAD